MTYIFGPVPSRRLGLSLGIDLIPPKTCTYDCLYCQVGKTRNKHLCPENFAPVTRVLAELKDTLEKIVPDVITLAGSGEPTLHSEIDKIIAGIKDLTDTRIVLLTNGSLLWNEEIRKRIRGVDIVMPTLSTVFEDTFRAIHRPHQDLRLPEIIQGIKTFRREFHGLMYLEVVLLDGFNDSDKEITGLKRVIDEISPDKVQLNTVVRPPSDPGARPLDRERLEYIKGLLGDRTEVIAGPAESRAGGDQGSPIETILEMARRRPVRVTDIAKTLKISAEETDRLVKGLLIKGRISKQEHLGENFFIAK